MIDRAKLLIHPNRIHTVFRNAIHYGPDGTKGGKFAAEHPAFTHYACAFYLAGCLSFFLGRDGSYSWNQTGAGGPKGLLAEVGVDRPGLTDAFFARWDKAAPDYISDHALKHPSDDIQTWMQDARRMYDWILRG